MSISWDRIEHIEKYGQTQPDLEKIDGELAEGRRILIQFQDLTYSDAALVSINELCRKYGPNIGIRFYTAFTSAFDYGTLLKIPAVQCLTISSSSAENFHVLGQLQHLERLDLSLFELKDTGFLSMKNLHGLIELRLDDSKTKALDLVHLKNFHRLKYLTLSGHGKNIAVVEHLTTLEHLCLRSINQVSVEFINRLVNLRSLFLLLGAKADIREIGDNNIQRLIIDRVRGFNNLDNISHFKNLQDLAIEDLAQLESIDFPQTLPYLAKIKISNCKSLSRLTGLDNLPTLTDLLLYKTAIDFDSFIRQTLPTRLKNFPFATSRVKTDEDIKKRLIAKGYQQISW